MILDARKKQFIRWYYGSFVNDRYADTIMFGVQRPLGAMRLSRNIARVQRHKTLLIAGAALLVVLVLFAIL